MRRLMAMRCPLGAQTGNLSTASTREFFTCVGRPTVVEVPTVSISGSLVRSASTGWLPRVPTALSSNCTSILIFSQTGGSVPGWPTSEPSIESDLVMAGSSVVPIATSPPAATTSRAVEPLCRLATLVRIGSQPLLVLRPGRISTSSPTAMLPDESLRDELAETVIARLPEMLAEAA